MNLKSIEPLLGFLAVLTGAIALPLTAFASIPEGTWVSTCQDGLSKLQIITEGTHSQTIEQFHQDRLCQRPSFVFITSGTLYFPNENSNLIDFTYTDIQLIVHVDEVIRDFNEREVCGLSNWKKSVPQTITGLNCALFNIHKPTTIPQAGGTKFGIYKLENDTLFYGRLSKENDSSTPEKRPTDYEFKGYKKQKPE